MTYPDAGHQLIADVRKAHPGRGAGSREPGAGCGDRLGSRHRAYSGVGPTTALTRTASTPLEAVRPPVSAGVADGAR